MIRFPVLFALLTSILWWVSYPGSGGFWPLAFFMFIPLFLSIYSAKNIRQAALCGLSTGVVYYSLLLYWIVNVLTHYGGLPWFAAIPAFLLLVLCMSGFLVLFCVITHQMRQYLSPLLVVWFVPALWVGIDWFRSFFLTGFPWMDPGYGLWEQTAFIQVADLTGHHGVTFLLIMINILLAQLITDRSRCCTVKVMITPILVITMVVGYSAIRLNQVVDALEIRPKTRVGMVQGNIRQEMKWSREKAKATLEGYLQKSSSLIKEAKPQFIIWPETALPFYPKYNDETVRLIRFVQQKGQHVITGAPWFVPLPKKSGKRGEYYNSALLYDQTGKVAGHYFKTHLVPFGEYIPFAKILFFVRPLVEAVGRFSSGKIERPLESGPAKVGPLICFESIFPDISRKWVGAGANLLANLTNDAWYGFSSAPHHSLAMTVLRAVETRRSIVRVANTGFSGFIDPLGRLRHKSPLFQPWIKSDDVVLMEGKTIYVRYGFLFAPFCCVVGIVGWLATVKRKRKKWC